MLESLLSTLPYPMLMAERMRALGLPTNVRQAPMLGVVRAADGWVGINCLTGQHWLDVCAMLGLPEFGEQQFAIMMGGPERAEFYAAAAAVAGRANRRRHRRTQSGTAHSGGSGQRRRRRAGHVRSTPSGGSSSRRREDWSFRRPGPPFRLSKTPAAPPRPAPRLGDGRDAITDRDGRPPTGRGSVAAVRGLKVLDLTTFWAGGYLTCYLGAFGADVVKVESIQRPDGFRYSGAQPFEGEDWYERSPLWQATNLNKRDITLDLSSPRRPRPRPPARRAGRRRGGELLAASGGAVRAGLRLAGGAAP